MIEAIQGVRVLVTGGAGFIGSELCRQLAALGANVIAVDNLLNGRRENLSGADSIRLEECDIRDLDRMSNLIRSVSVIFHLACLGVRHSIHSPYENHTVNAATTLQLLELARKATVERFVCVSTSEVYGTSQRVPITEEHPTFPYTVYGASKLAGECYTRAFYQTYGFPAVIIRPFNAYGPNCHHEGDSGEVIPKFILRCMAGKPMVIFGDGMQTRDFTYVTDTARGILAAGWAEGVVGKTINIGSGSEINICDLARKVAEVVGHPDAEIKHIDPRPGDVLRLCAGAEQATRLLDFSTKTSLREGLAMTVAWYRSQEVTPVELLEMEVERNWMSGKDSKA